MKKNLPKWIWQQTNEVAFGKTKSCKNIHMQKHKLAKEATKQSTNGENLN
jgi:hypothetical protein